MTPCNECGGLGWGIRENTDIHCEREWDVNPCSSCKSKFCDLGDNIKRTFHQARSQPALLEAAEDAAVTLEVVIKTHLDGSYAGITGVKLAKLKSAIAAAKEGR